MAITPTSGANPSAESARSGLSIDALRRGVLDNMICLQARTPGIATPHDWYMALAIACVTACWRAGPQRSRPMPSAIYAWRATSPPSS
ncbi:hypothetical protein LMG28688_06339 [Paraburkholderia caffeinitolerans]|uniref:Uncharacterized protein n=1 Tax=Paraburkholderia caffeinitolerans TaxID=1723730 RepID=A0A6J5GSJ6_9BURK|nr:hypothetical protein LMG28688_06339 [Paraburkholderia caffeinitolerans]